jgi:hypothetical protein
VCEDDVVARVVLAATTGRGGAGETEFEDHVGGYVRVIGVWYSYAMQWAMAISNLQVAGRLLQFAAAGGLERDIYRVRVWKLRPRYATLGK